MTINMFNSDKEYKEFADLTGRMLLLLVRNAGSGSRLKIFEEFVATTLKDVRELVVDMKANLNDS